MANHSQPAKFCFLSQGPRIQILELEPTLPDHCSLLLSVASSIEHKKVLSSTPTPTRNAQMAKRGAEGQKTRDDAASDSEEDVSPHPWQALTSSPERAAATCGRSRGEREYISTGCADDRIRGLPKRKGVSPPHARHPECR